MQLRACLKYPSSHQLLHQNVSEEMEGNAVDLGIFFLMETLPLFEIISQHHIY
jgi:hypothetical protein